MKYQIQCLEIATDGTNAPDLSAEPRLSIVCETSDHDVLMSNWASYCSGAHDAEEPHALASYFAFPARFFRIVAVDE